VSDSDQFLVESSRTPFLDSARALLAAGLADPSDSIVMRHQGSPHDALRSRIDVAAKLTVREETTDGKPRFVSWISHPKAAPNVQGSPPMRPKGEEALSSPKTPLWAHDGAAPSAGDGNALVCSRLALERGR
jgi:hypothetical protein